MAEEEYQGRNSSPWRNARMGSRENQAEMAANGRAPSFDRGGNIRGFRSRPGAPQSPMDNMANQGIRSPVGSADHGFAWNKFFSNSRAATAASGGAFAGAAQPADTTPFRQTSAGPTFDYDGTYVGIDPGTDVASTPAAPMSDASYISEATDGNKAWMGSNGFAVPPLSGMPGATVTNTPESGYGTAGTTIRSKYGFATNVRPYWRSDVANSKIPRIPPVSGI